MSSDEKADKCWQKLRDVEIVISKLKQEQTESFMKLIAIVAKLQDFQVVLCEDDDWDHVILVLDEILQEFQR